MTQAMSDQRPGATALARIAQAAASELASAAWRLSAGGRPRRDELRSTHLAVRRQ
jgi:hypothetical protein